MFGEEEALWQLQESCRFMPAIRDSWTCCSEFGRVYETKTGQKYSKADGQMYGKICKAGDEEKAIQIAQQKLEQCKREGKIKPSEMCPCTTVHKLVGRLEVKNNIEKFDEDFMFELKDAEVENLRSNFLTAKWMEEFYGRR